MMPIHTPRPVGIWIFTLWAGIIFGILPLVLGISALLVSIDRFILLPSLLVVLPGAITLSCAIGTWRGSRAARNCLVIILLSFSTIQVVQLLNEVSGGHVRKSEHGFLWAKIFSRCVTQMIICGYLFLSRRAIDFFDPSNWREDRW